MCVCVSVSQSVSMSACLPVSQPVCLSVWLFASVCVCVCMQSALFTFGGFWSWLLLSNSLVTRKISKGLAASVVGAQPGFMLPILQSPICVRRQHRNMVVGVIVRATVTSDSPHGVPAIVVFISPALHNFQAQGT